MMAIIRLVCSICCPHAGPRLYLILVPCLVCHGCVLQRLGGLGYCFSASLPPYLASGALAALHEMEAHPELRLKLQANIKAFRDGMPLGTPLGHSRGTLSEPVAVPEALIFSV